MADIYVESIVFSQSHFRIHFGTSLALWTSGEDPVEALIIRTQQSAELNWYYHSTSWRRALDRNIVLTYGIVPPSLEAYLSLTLGSDAQPLVQPDASHPPDRPDTDPLRLTANQVAWHAARHLSFLYRTAPGQVSAQCKSEWSMELWRLLSELPWGLAGEVSV